MRDINVNGETGLSQEGMQGQPFMEKYDLLPAQIRKVLQEAPVNVVFREDYDIRLIRDWMAPAIKKQIEEDIKNGTRETYGPDHPQA